MDSSDSAALYCFNPVVFNALGSTRDALSPPELDPTAAKARVGVGRAIRLVGGTDIGCLEVVTGNERRVVEVVYVYALVIWASELSERDTNRENPCLAPRRETRPLIAIRGHVRAII